MARSDGNPDSNEVFGTVEAGIPFAFDFQLKDGLLRRSVWPTPETIR